MNWLFRNADLQIYRGEKIALVGINGAGKTTLTRIITGQLTPTEGEIISGEKVITGYYAQHQLEALDLKKSVYEEVYTTAADPYRTKVRDILGIFKFSGEDIEKPIGVLSGGEKARVSLAKILISPVNFLVMDEPTNHLDMEAKEALEDALRAYDGTLLLISHDRYFLDQIVSRVIEISNGIFTLYEGNYTDYLSHKEQRTITEKMVVSDDMNDREGFSRKKQRRIEAEARQKISGLRQTLNQKITTIESEIDRLEQEKKLIEKKMSDPAFYKSDDQAADAGRRYQELLSEIPRLVRDWEKAHLELDNIISSIGKAE
jgi:ATP-binding cassette subfamily F protein 3